MQKRIEYLDGLRGVAIILVILFHAYYGWRDTLPFGSKYENIIIFKYGFLGVQLFFLISGFVILMTLERSKNYLIFGYKRWIRLFPAMLIATIFIYATASIFYERPRGIPTEWSVVPGLTFIEPNIIERVFDVEFTALEGSFWSLYLEVKFYIIFGALYFIFGRNRAIILFFMLYLSMYLNHRIVDNYLGLREWNIWQNISIYILNREYGWFIAGCLAYIYYQRREGHRQIYLLLSFLLALWCVFLKYREHYTIDVILVGLMILGVFYLPLVYDKIGKIFSHRILLFVGFISYPLYLIHENMMISMIIQLHRKFSTIPDFLLPLIALVPIVIISYIITKWGEPLLRTKIDNLIGKRFFK